MEKKITRYLKSSFLVVAVICIGLFVFMGVYLNKEIGSTTKEVSHLYMEEIHSQLQQKFDTILKLRAMQLDAIIETAEKADNWTDEIIDELENSATARDFIAAGLYRSDGAIEMIYGDEIEIDDKLAVNCTCENQNHMIQLGYTNEGEKVLILGRIEELQMSDGEMSEVLFAVLPFSYFNDAMYLDVPETQVTSHVIDSEGNYIIKNKEAEKYDTVYERISSDFEGIDGKTTGDYVTEVKEALEHDREYSSRYIADGEVRMIYVSRLTDGLDWYVMTVMPDEDIDGLLSGLYTTRYMVMFGVVIAIIAVLLCVFMGYYRLSREQMKELHKAREAAVDANEAKSRFLTSMSHDIRTPMNAIIGMSDIAMKNLDNNKEKAATCLRKVQLSSKHLLGLINDILDMSSIESGKLTIENRDVALHQLTSECVDIIQPQIKAKRQTFDVFIGDIISEHIYSDSVRLQQIILNLLSNATKYTPEGGRVYLHIYQEKSSLGEDYVRNICEVEDNGIGMSEEFLEEIFDRFAREDKEYVKNVNGSGLGMAIIKSIVDMMGGTIEIKSKLNEGSKFRVVLDVKKGTVEEGDMKLPAWKALVVDDNEQLCQSAADTLAELGLIAEWTQDGMEAIRMVEEQHAKGEDYHFVLIDWQMPNMDGIETIRELRKRITADIPIFIISAYNWTDVENVLDDTEIAGFISKPLFKSNLYMHLTQYIDHEALQENTDDETVDFTGHTLLLAEDNDINYEIVDEVLSAYGIKIERAENGKVCVEMFEAADKGYYSAILMDVHMPVMDGYEATKTIRAMDREDNALPIIAMTADVFSDNMERCMESGMNECITKPLDVAECLRVLKKYLVSQEV